MNEYSPIIIDREDGLISGGNHGIGAVINKEYEI